MSFNELNSVEHYIIQKLSGVNLNTADPTSSVVKEDAAIYGSSPWQYRSAESLSRPTDQILSLNFTSLNSDDSRPAKVPGNEAYHCPTQGL